MSRSQGNRASVTSSWDVQALAYRTRPESRSQSNRASVTRASAAPKVDPTVAGLDPRAIEHPLRVKTEGALFCWSSLDPKAIEHPLRGRLGRFTHTKIQGSRSQSNLASVTRRAPLPCPARRPARVSIPKQSSIRYEAPRSMTPNSPSSSRRSRSQSNRASVARDHLSTAILSGTWRPLRERSPIGGPSRLVAA